MLTLTPRARPSRNTSTRRSTSQYSATQKVTHQPLITSRSSSSRRRPLPTSSDESSTLRFLSVNYARVAKCFQYVLITMDEFGRVTMSLELKQHVSPVTLHLPGRVTISKLFPKKTRSAKKATHYVMWCV